MASPVSHRRPPAWRILVAGAGIPSLAFALAVRQAAGDAVAVTVTDPGRGGADPRAYALSRAASRMLDRLGLWPAVRGRAQPIAEMRITDSRLDDPVRPDYLGFREDASGPLGYMVEAADLSAELATACRASGIVFRTGAVTGFEAGPHGIEAASSETGPSLVSLLVAADGARSRLREAAGIGWVGRRYPQSGIVATVAHERDHCGRAVQHFLPAGPFAILPLAGPGRAFPHRSSIVWTEDEALAPALLEQPPEAALRSVEARFGHELGRLALETRLFAHPLAVGLARRFAATRFALLGDAAHEIHPLAGQGLNLGLADAAALAEHVVDAVRLGLDPGSDEVLVRYERDRRFDAVAIAGVTDGLNRLFSNDSLPVRSLRDFGLGLVDRAAGVKGFLAGEASGLTGRAPRLMRGEAI